jgi:hypothetical protein
MFTPFASARSEPNTTKRENSNYRPVGDERQTRGAVLCGKAIVVLFFLPNNRQRVSSAIRFARVCRHAAGGGIFFSNGPAPVGDRLNSGGRRMGGGEHLFETVDGQLIDAQKAVPSTSAFYCHVTKQVLSTFCANLLHAT